MKIRSSTKSEVSSLNLPSYNRISTEALDARIDRAVSELLITLLSVVNGDPGNSSPACSIPWLLILSVAPACSPCPTTPSTTADIIWDPLQQLPDVAPSMGCPIYLFFAKVCKLLETLHYGTEYKAAMP